VAIPAIFGNAFIPQAIQDNPHHAQDRFSDNAAVLVGSRWCTERDYVGEQNRAVLPVQRMRAIRLETG
jgi:hypothetical protein